MKYLIYIISFLFVMNFAGCDNAKSTKVDVNVTAEDAEVEKNTIENEKCFKRKCENKKKCKDKKSCKHKCNKDNEDCKKGENCKGMHKCEKAENAVKAHRCGEGKCGGDNIKEVIKEETEE